MVKNPPANAGDIGLIPGSGRAPVEENDNPFQYSCLGNHTERELGGVATIGQDKATKQYILHHFM